MIKNHDDTDLITSVAMGDIHIVLISWFMLCRLSELIKVWYIKWIRLLGLS